MENLRKVIKISQESGIEEDVSAVSLGLLEIAGKTLTNGYIVRSQHRITLGIPDITVEVLYNQQPLLVIECKSSKGNMNIGENQIIAYMVDGIYPHGILINPSKAKYYNMLSEAPELIQTLILPGKLSELVRLVEELSE